MTTPIGPIAGIASLPTLGAANAVGAQSASQVSGAAATASSSSAVSGASGNALDDFSTAMANGIEAVNASQHHANQLAVQAATGKLDNPAELTIATTKAQLMTKLATTIESKAVSSFKMIMSMRA